MLSELDDGGSGPLVSEEALASLPLLHALGLPFALMELDGRVVEWSPAVAAFTGYGAADMIGGSINRVRLVGWEAPTMSVLLGELLDGGRWQGELTLLDRADTEVHVEARASVLVGEHGQASKVLWVLTDVTERVRAKERASTLESQLRMAQRVGDLGCWEWDVATDRLVTSDAFQALLGLPPGTPLAMQDALNAMMPADRERMQATIDRLMQDPAPRQINYRVRTPGGATQWLEAHCVGVMSGAGEVVAVRGTTINVTGRVREAERLRDADEFWQHTLDSLAAHVAVLDDTGTIVAVNESWRRFSRDEGTGEDWIGTDYVWVCESSGEPLAAEVAAGLRQILRGERSNFELEYPCHSPARPAWFLLRATRCQGSGPVRVVVAHEPITSLRLAEQRASLQARLLDEIDVAVISTDVDYTVRSWNAGAQALYGWSAEEAMGRRLIDLIASDEASRSAHVPPASERRPTDGERTLRRKDGSLFSAYVRTRVIEDAAGGPPTIVGISIDVTERKAAERALLGARNYLRAVTDSMGDGMYTLDAAGRVTYMNQVAQELLGWPLEEVVGQLMRDLILRAPAGERQEPGEPAIDVAGRERRVIRVQDDQFMRRDGTLVPVAYTAAPFETEEGGEGWVVVFQDITERKGREEQLRRDLEKLSWLNRVNDAIAQRRFVLHAQPIIDLRTGEVAQRELLIRMSAPGRDGEPPETIPPGRFLPIAEEYGSILDIDRWVTDRAAEISASGTPCELNVSARSISDPRFVDHVRAALRRTGADPEMLVFEITETALVSDEAAASRFVQQVHELGCRVALDDFGTGYGGFTYLKQLPIDFLKIDIEFVRDLRDNAASHNVVQAVVSLAKGFNLQTVAEGVEDAETLEILRTLGVDHAQGFYIGRPAPMEPAVDQRDGKGSA